MFNNFFKILTLFAYITNILSYIKMFQTKVEHFDYFKKKHYNRPILLGEMKTSNSKYMCYIKLNLGVNGINLFVC